MSVEFENQPVVVSLAEKEEQRKFCLFIPGGSTTQEGMRPALTGLNEEFGPGNVAIVDSVLSPQARWSHAKEEGSLILNQLKSGAHVTLAVHSFGLAQLERAFHYMIKQKPNLLKEYKDSLDVRVDAGTGMFKGMQDSLTYLKNFSTFVLSEEGLADDVLHGRLNSEPHLRGLVSLFTFPPESIEMDVLSQKLREAFPHLASQRTDEPLPEIPHELTRDYTTKFDPKDKQALIELDARFKQAIDNGDLDSIRELTLARGELTKEYIKAAYRGDYADDFGDVEVSRTPRWFGAAFLGLVRSSASAYQSMVRGKPGRMLLQMEEAGIPILYVVRDFDVTMTREQIEEYYQAKTGGERTPNIAIMPRAIHKGPLGTEPSMARRIVTYERPQEH